MAGRKTNESALSKLLKSFEEMMDHAEKTMTHAEFTETVRRSLKHLDEVIARSKSAKP